MSIVTSPRSDAPPQPPRGVSPVDAYRHTMSDDRLLRYLQIKAHHLLDQREWERVIVLGDHDRGCVISTREKRDKLFNWQRPTAQPDGDSIVIKAFPGTDYVHHYGLIIATYLTMVGRYRGQVEYQLPSTAQCVAAVRELDVDVADDDLVVLGWGLAHLAPTRAWVYSGGYAYSRAVVEGRRVVYLGFLHSIWGDVAGRVVARLAQLGARRVVYVGKVGTLDPTVAPNRCLATGDTSITADGEVTWKDFFAGIATQRQGIRFGVHVTSPSILLEGRDWIDTQDRAVFVDPEIGHMGRAANDAGIEFGYLHVISNNLVREHPADLSNERAADVLRRRADLLRDIDAVLRLRLHNLPNREA